MKTILNPNNGRPLKNEDAELFQQFIDIFEDMFGRINGIGDFIVSGCEIIAGLDVNPGFIYYDGKICTFEGVTGVGFPLAMERVSVDGTPRTFFDGVSKNAINTETIVAQVGGGFSLSSSTPRLDEYYLRASTTAEMTAGSGDGAVTATQLLSAFRTLAAYAASETNRGAARIADETTARTGSDNTEIMTPLRVLDALRNGTNYLAQTSYPGVRELATQSEVDAGTTNNIVTPTTLAGKDGGLIRTVIDIGDWNMDSTASVNVAHGLTLSDIRGVYILIRNDANSVYYPHNYDIGTGAAGRFVLSSTNVVVSRTLGGQFDSTDYNSTSYNRGWIIIDSIP